MVKTGGDIYLRIPHESSERILNKAIVVSVDENVIGLELHRSAPGLCAGEDAIVYFESEQEFVQQCVVVDEVRELADTTSVQVRTVGDPFSAEARRHHRVSTRDAGVEAELRGEACDVLDVSATGFAVASGLSHKAGIILRAVLRFAGRSYAGNVCIQSYRMLSPERFRYGLRVLEHSESGSGDDLALGLGQISMAVRRQKRARA